MLCEDYQKAALMEVAPLGALMRPQLNGLQRALQVAKSERGSNERGALLNTRGGALTRTVVSAREGLNNADRYRRVPQQKPKVKAEMAFALDFSGSMDRFPLWGGVCSLLGALIPQLQRMGVAVQAAAIDLNEHYYSAQGKQGEGSVSSTPIIRRIPTARWDEERTKRLLACDPNSGTSIACYAQAAWDMLRDSRATHKVGFYLTDGRDDESYPFLASIEEQAAREGVHLVGVAFGRLAGSIAPYLPPKSISAASARELGVTLIPHLTAVIKRGV